MAAAHGTRAHRCARSPTRARLDDAERMARGGGASLTASLGEVLVLRGRLSEADSGIRVAIVATMRRASHRRGRACRAGLPARRSRGGVSSRERARGLVRESNVGMVGGRSRGGWSRLRDPRRAQRRGGAPGTRGIRQGRRRGFHESRSAAARRRSVPREVQRAGREGLVRGRAQALARSRARAARSGARGGVRRKDRVDDVAASQPDGQPVARERAGAVGALSARGRGVRLGQGGGAPRARGGFGVAARVVDARRSGVAQGRLGGIQSREVGRRAVELQAVGLLRRAGGSGSAPAALCGRHAHRARGARHRLHVRACSGLLGNNQLHAGNIEEGRALLERAFAIDPFNLWHKNTLDLLDNLRTFRTIDRGHFRIVAPPKEAELLATYLVPLLEEAYDSLSARYHYKPPGRCGSSSTGSTRTSPCARWVSRDSARWA